MVGTFHCHGGFRGCNVYNQTSLSWHTRKAEGFISLVSIARFKQNEQISVIFQSPCLQLCTLDGGSIRKPDNNDIRYFMYIICIYSHIYAHVLIPWIYLHIHNNRYLHVCIYIYIFIHLYVFLVYSKIKIVQGFPASQVVNPVPQVAKACVTFKAAPGRDRLRVGGREHVTWWYWMDMVSIGCVTIKCLYVYYMQICWFFVYLLALYDFDTSLEMPDHVVVFCFFLLWQIYRLHCCKIAHRTRQPHKQRCWYVGIEMLATKV